MGRTFQIAVLGAVGLAAALSACAQAGGPADAEVAAGPTLVSAADLDGALSAQIPSDLVIHAHHGAIAATAPDGSFRIFVGREEAGPLIKLTGPAKDALSALGWAVEGEQYYEQAIFVALRRGGTRDAPKERRQMWWVSRDEGSYVCDAIARTGSYGRLGTSHRALCQGVGISALTP